MRKTAQGGRTRFPAELITLVLLLLCSCGGGGSQKSSDTPQSDGNKALHLTLRSSGTANDQVTVSLLAENSAGLYQLSTRLSFNPAAVRPIGPAQRGSLIAADAIFYSNDRQSEFVPIAFSNRLGESVSQSSGELCTQRFEIVDANADPQFNLLRDTDFLIARDNSARDIAVQVEVKK
jgi:hypothetical protein